MQTPAAFLGPEKKDSHKPSSGRPTSPRLRRSKIKVHESTSVQNDILSQDPDQREIEYMPPRETPLPDDFDHIWPADRTYPQFEGQNLTRGWYSAFAPQKDPDEPYLSDFEEKLRKCEENQEREKQKAKVAPLGKKSTNAQAKPTTMKAQNAASALASRPAAAKKPGIPSFAASTAATKARQPANSTVASKKHPMFDRGNPRFTAAKAASNSTIGYSKGRVVSANRRPLNEIHTKPQEDKQTEERYTLDDLLGLGTMDLSGDSPGMGCDNCAAELGAKGLFDDDEEEEVFHLDPMEDL